MFDKDIQDKLNQFADNYKPSQSILTNALAELDNKKCKVKSKEVRQWKYLAIPMVLIIVAVAIVGGTFMFNSSINPPTSGPAVTVSLADLYIGKLDASTINGYKHLSLEGYTYAMRGFYHKQTNELVIISVKYKSVSNQGISEVVVISEESKYRCEELEKYREKNQYTDYYINGEYETFHSYKDDTRNYWTSIQANYMAGKEVINNIFN